MKQYATQGIVLTRTDYGEADRILTFLTKDHGKIKAIAKGVRKSKAKLAGSIELFSVSDLTVIVGRGEINTLISARLMRHYGNIVKSIDRTNEGYDFLKILNKATEDQPEEAYFNLLDRALGALDDSEISPELTKLWFRMQLLKLAGHAPNLHSDESGKKLAQSKTYSFDFDKMKFAPKEQGEFNVNHIKFLRLGFGNNAPKALQRIEGALNLINDCQALIDTILKTYVRI
ncbi:MAG TPA: DNA repair protein RecO [Candidatus Saccharimonadales bacterium]|nr:DNA repair protein RecO [Candidatus Saccharimonadales bacterium]